jgi:hypothetical protein
MEDDVPVSTYGDAGLTAYRNGHSLGGDLGGE